MKIEQDITIAVVDDHDLVREKICEILSEFGFDIILKASNGREFLDMLCSFQVFPDVCLLDISMPIMNGFETAEKLKELYPAIKILAFSFDNDEITIEKIIKNGAHGFISKSIGNTGLRDKLVELYNNNFN